MLAQAIEAEATGPQGRREAVCRLRRSAPALGRSSDRALIEFELFVAVLGASYYTKRSADEGLRRAVPPRPAGAQACHRPVAAAGGRKGGRGAVAA